MTSEEQISIVIDDKRVQTRSGAVVLEAAIEAGIYVPYLCYHLGMKPFAACRLCLVQEEVEVEVEQEGETVRQRQLRPATASCTLPVREGMVVRTATDNVRELERGVMEMLISEHPHGCLTCHRVDLCGPQDICQRHVSVNDRCVTCPKNERCELKESVRFLGMDLNSPLSYKTRGLELEVADPFYDLDYNLCIVCGRCVRVCDEVRGDSAITFVERAGRSLVGTSRGTSLLQSGCEFCGACIDVCPVGALVEREHKWDKAVRVERTVCSQCPVGCQLNLEVNKREKVIRAVPEIQAPANHGQACFKGKFGLEYVNHRDRLRRPLIRRDGELQEATWDEALGYIAEWLREYKGEQFAAFASARSTNEVAYLLQKFTRTVMETNSVDMDSNGRPGLTRALADTLGYAASTNSIWELEKAGCVLVVDANVTEEQNVVAVPVKKAVRAGTAKLIVIDEREVELTHYAHIWLRPRPGTTLYLLGGMLRYILDEALAEPGFIDERCEGLDELRTSLEVFDLEAVSRITGVDAERVREAATMFATTGPSSILYALDNVPPEQQPMNVYALTNLALVTGNVGKPSAGLYGLHRGTNQQGAMDVGCVPDLLPGYQQMDESPGQYAIQTVWGQRVPREPGLGLREALAAARDGTVKSMLLLGDSIDYTSGELGDGYAALQKLEFLVVHDAFLGSAAQLADVVLPATTFAEEDGTYTNLERRVQLLKRVITPKNSEAWPAWRLLSTLAHLMNAPGFEYANPSEVFDEIAQVTSIYAGVTHERLVREAVVTLRPDPGNPQPTQMLYSDRVSQGLQWPCPDPDGPGTPVLYESGFPNDKAHLMPLEAPAATQLTTDEYPFLFVQGRVLAQWEREVEVIRTDGMNHIQREELLELHPQDAAALELSQGDAVEMAGEGWHMSAAAYVTERSHPGVVSMTTLFGELATKLQLSEDPDPMSKIPGLRVCPVRVKKVAL